MSTTYLEILAAGEKGYDRDSLFAFVTAFQALTEPLRGYLDHLFRPSAYHEAFFFRGVYFCGASGAEGPTSVVPPDGLPASPETPAATTAVTLATPSVAPQPVFVKQVFADKILPEYGLARPVSTTFQVRNRTVVLAQGLLIGLALVWGLGLWKAAYSLEQGKNSLVPVLREIHQALKADKN
jgi:type VI secretion system protein ImpL